jgi:hypothetical protein
MPAWAQNAAVKERYRDLLSGFDKWREANKTAKRTQYPALTYMRRINAWLEQAAITFEDDGGEPVDAHDRVLRRLFVIHEGDTAGQRFDLSGRLFGGFWQPPLFPCSHSARSPRVSCSNVD